MSDLHTISFVKNGLNFDVEVICYNEFCLFDENWKGTDDHIGGVTVKNPEADRNSWKYFIPEFSLAERIEALIANGTPADKASGQAYKDAQQALRRDIHASDYGFRVTVSYGDTVLISDEPVGSSFDYSYHDRETLECAAEETFSELAIDAECVGMALTAAREALDGVKLLQAFIDENKGA